MLVALFAAVDAGTAATSPCVAKDCLYNVRIEVSYRNLNPYFGAHRPTGTISARMNATFSRVPFRQLRLNGGSRSMAIHRGLKSHESDTTAPGTIRATVTATTPCRVNRTYGLPALLYVNARSTPRYYSLGVSFGPETEPTPSGCAGTAFGLGKILAAGGAIDSGSGTTYITLGEEVQTDVGKNDSGALAGSYENTSLQSALPPLTHLLAGRSFSVAHAWRPEATGGRSSAVGTSGTFRMTFTRVA
jgi:hypothetical protein